MFNYFIYDAGFLTAGFLSLEDAVSFAEEQKPIGYIKVEIDLVAANTGEVIDTWDGSAWENA